MASKPPLSSGITESCKETFAICSFTSPNYDVNSEVDVSLGSAQTQRWDDGVNVPNPLVGPPQGFHPDTLNV